MNRPRSLVALSVALVLGAAACGTTADATPTAAPEPTSTTAGIASADTSPFAGRTAVTGDMDEATFRAAVRGGAPSIDADLALGWAKLTCDMLNDGDNPAAVIIGAYRAATAKGYDTGEIGYVMGAGVRVFCPAQWQTFSDTTTAMVAAIDAD